MTLHARVVQRRPHVVIPEVDVGTPFEKSADSVDVAVCGGDVEGGESFGVGGVDFHLWWASGASLKLL